MSVRRWCEVHDVYDGCPVSSFAPLGPFDLVPTIVDDETTERTIVGIPPAPMVPPVIGAPPEIGAVPTDEFDLAATSEWIASDADRTAKIVRFEEKAENLDSAAAILDAKKKVLATVFEVMLEAGWGPAQCNEILFRAVDRLGLRPGTEGADAGDSEKNLAPENEVK